jgi:RNA polymerase sigma-70 factor (ECF subfamily)
MIEQETGPRGPEALVVAAYEQYRDELQGYLARVTRDPEVASDLVQEAFLKLLLEARHRDAPDNVRAWLYRVATNAAVSRGRRLSTANALGDRVPGPQPADDPEDACLRAEERRCVERLLSRVRPDERRALLLAADGVEGAQIAVAIGRSHVATRTLIHRARARLRAEALLEVA